MDPITKLDDLLCREFPEQTYIVERLIPDSSITIFSGHSRSFKTYTLLEIALCVASGKPLFGEFPCYQAGVLIIDEENGQRLLQKRLRQLQAANELPIYFTPQMGFELSNETIDNVLLSCKTYGIKLVIIDSLIRIHGSDENSAKDMSKVFKQLRRFTEQDVAVLVTQHHRKPGANNGGAGNEMRGSGDILAAVDSHMAVVRKEKWYLTFDQTKQRYDVELDPFEIKVSVDDDRFTFEYLGSRQIQANKSEKTFEAVTSLLAKHGPLKQKELIEKLAEANFKTNEHTLRQLLNRWVAEGVLPTPLAGNGNSKHYHLGKGAGDE